MVTILDAVVYILQEAMIQTLVLEKLYYMYLLESE